MHDLGCERYGAAGNDWGSFVAPALGRIAPEAVVGVRVTQRWTAEPSEPDVLDQTDRAAVADLAWFERTTGTGGPAPRIYDEHAREPQPDGPTTIPLATAQFADDYQPVRSPAPRAHARIVSGNRYDRAGPFAAHQSPDLLVADLQRFFLGGRRG
jgi:epoxide hydrolase